MDKEKQTQSDNNGSERRIRISDVAKKAIELNPDLSAMNSHVNAFKDMASSPAMKASMGSTLSLMKDLDSQTGQLKKMFSMQNQLADVVRPAMSMSEKIKGLTSLSERLPKLELPPVMGFPTSALQVHDMSEALHHVQAAAIEEKVMQRKGVEEQIESAKILADQRVELEVMREVKHTLEQSNQQATAFQERDKVESERFRENTQLSKIATWAGVVSTIVGAVSMILAAIAIWFH